MGGAQDKYCMNKKSLYAVVAIVACYALVWKVSRPETELRGGIGFITFGLLVVLPFSALVLAALGLRQVHASRKADPTPRYWPAIGAVVLVFSFVGSFGVYAASHWRQRTSELHPNPETSIWTQFTSPNGDFTVLLPEVATETTRTVQGADGPVTLRSVAAVAGAGAGYSITIGALPNDAGESSTGRLDRLEADFVQRSNGKLLARSTVSAGSVVGSELRVSSTERSLRVRIFVMNGHVYQVLVIRPPSAEESVLDERFLGSFTLHGLSSRR
jgi:hypothetical protein